MENDLLTLETVSELLGKTVRAIQYMVKRGELEAIYQPTGKRGRPKMMITASSYGKYLLAKGGK